ADVEGLAAVAALVGGADDAHERAGERHVGEDALAGDELDLVDDPLLGGGGHGDEDPVLADEHGEELVADGDLTGDDVEVAEADADLVEVDAGDAALLRQGLEGRYLREGAGL